MNLLQDFWDSYKPLLFTVLSVYTFLEFVDFGTSDIVVIASFIGPFLTIDRIPFLVISLLFLYFAITTWRHRNTPLTVISTNIKLYYDEPDGSVVRLTSDRLIRANHRRVTAYYAGLKPGGGRIPESRMRWWIESNDYHPSEDIKYVGDETKGWEIIHGFNPPIPRKWYYLNLNKVKRCGEAIFLDCFTKKEEYYQISTLAYPHRKITVEIFFHPNRKPRNWKAQRFLANGVEDEHLEYVPPDENGRARLRLTIKKSRNARHRITWNF